MSRTSHARDIQRLDLLIQVVTVTEPMRPDLSGVDPLTVNLTHRVCMGDLPTRAATAYGDRAALIDGDTTVSFRELEARSNSVARGLLSRGYQRGDAVALQMMNRWQFMASFFGCAKIGVTVVPLNLLLSPSDVAYQLTDSGVLAVLTEEALLPSLTASLGADGHRVREVFVLGAAPADVAGVPASPWDGLLDPDGSRVEAIVEDRDIIHCLYTSGTTSAPKGVLTSHLAVQLGSLSSALAVGLRPSSSGGVQPIVLPLFHVTALDAVLLPTLTAGYTAVLHRGFDPAALAEDFRKHRVTNIALLPMMWQALLAQPALHEPDADTSSMRTGFYAMAPMPPTLLTAVHEAFPNAEIILGSGQTETTPISQMQWVEHQGTKDNSWGAAVATTEVQILGPDGQVLPTGAVGEIAYRTPQLMEGYWNNADANTTAFGDGWFRGGDIGYLDDEGTVWFTDRAKDIVKTGGENVSSVEVERVLLSHPGVAETAVVGMPHERWGEAVTAYVVVVEGEAPTGAELTAYAVERLAKFKVPKSFVLVDALPKTATGKIRKVELRNPRG